MKTTLIEHNNELYLVNNDEANVDDIIYDSTNERVVAIFETYGLTDYKKILASEKSTPKGLIIPSDLMEVFKGVDMAEIAYTNLLEKSEQDKNHVGYGKGLNGVEKSRWKSIYNQALQDNKDKKWTDEDFRKMWDYFKSLYDNRNGEKVHINKPTVDYPVDFKDFGSFLNSIQPKKEWKVEIETWTNGNWESYCEERRQCVNCFETNLKSEPYNCKCGLKPKLTKNSEGKECYTITKNI